MENTNKLVLFNNTDRKTESHPHKTGKGTVNGIDYKIAAWINISKAGEEYLTIYLNPVIKIDDTKTPQEYKIKISNDDIPF